MLGFSSKTNPNPNMKHTLHSECVKLSGMWGDHTGATTERERKNRQTDILQLQNSNNNARNNVEQVTNLQH